jgi:PDZ domain-containing protein
MRKYLPSLVTTLGLLIVIAASIPVPYVLLEPGPVFNTLGSDSGKPIIKIAGTKTYPTTGELNMTTVSESGGPEEGINLFQATWGWLNPDATVLPREALYDEGTTQEEDFQAASEDFSTSQSNAIAAALRYLDKPVHTELTITSISYGAPADGKLHAGDHILSVDGYAATSPARVVQIIRSQKIGTTHAFVVDRANKGTTVKVKSAAHPDDPTTKIDERKTPYVGIGVGYFYRADFTINFGLEDVGGPSAGGMFALALIDKLTPGPLTDGKIIAGTGTMSPTGKVGPIGGIQHKLLGASKAGAKLFLAPRSNCDEVVGHIPAGLTVVPVSTLGQAVAAINGFNAGNKLPQCLDSN